jgi:hypothetical protein
MALGTASTDFKTKKPLYKPVKSTKQGKKGMVYVKNASGGKKLIHFGDSKMSDFTKHKDSGRRANYLARSGGIRDKSGKLTANNKNSANYWARKVLWKG